MAILLKKKKKKKGLRLYLVWDFLGFARIKKKPVEAGIGSGWEAGKALEADSRERRKGGEEIKVLRSWGWDSGAFGEHSRPPPTEPATSNTLTKDRKHGSYAGMLT